RPAAGRLLDGGRRPGGPSRASHGRRCRRGWSSSAGSYSSCGVLAGIVGTLLLVETMLPGGAWHARRGVRLVPGPYQATSDALEPSPASERASTPAAVRLGSVNVASRHSLPQGLPRPAIPGAVRR